MSETKRMLVMDACVLIDICLEDPAILGLAASSLGKVVVLSPVLEEVHQLDDAVVNHLGLSAVEPEIELVIEASVRRGGLSFRDRMCLFYARDTQATLYTNDKALLNAARSIAVDSRWGLEILLELVAVGRLTPSAAEKTAKSICDRSRFTSCLVMAEFRRRLGEV